MRIPRILAACFFVATAAQAALINLSGNFTQDDDVQLFHYQVANTGLVTVSTTSFATGGFSPILTLFDAAGQYQFDNSGYGSSADATITWNSLGGQWYIVALTQYDNSSVGPALSDGFVRSGQGNFTAASPFNPPTPGGSFLLPGPEQRTSAWAVEFSSADPTLTASAVPEPSTMLTSIFGGAILVRIAVRRRKKRS